MLRGKRLLPVSIIFFGLLLIAVSVQSSVEGDMTAFVKALYTNKDVQVSFSQLPSHVRDMTKARNIRFAKVPDEDGNGVCLVELEGKKGAKSTVNVPFKVMVKRKLYMAKHDIAKGEAIKASDITENETYLNGSKEGYPSDLEEIEHKAAKRNIASGRIITRDLLDDQVVLKRGEAVIVTAQNNRLMVQTKGTALERGKIGDMVRIKSASGKEVFGKVIGSNTVAVEF
jgi:flagellar basal body P-ring formation protein FlgA